MDRKQQIEIEIRVLKWELNSGYLGNPVSELDRAHRIYNKIKALRKELNEINNPPK